MNYFTKLLRALSRKGSSGQVQTEKETPPVPTSSSGSVSPFPEIQTEDGLPSEAQPEPYRYFGRDLSWLSFNERVLTESLKKTVPIYARLNFLSIFSSNLEEFYQIRVAGAKASIARRKRDGRDLEDRECELKEVIEEVKRQETVFRSAWEDVMVPDLKAAGIDIYTDFKDFMPKIEALVAPFFREEVFPFLQPTLLDTSLVRTFIRDKRIYLAVRLRHRESGETVYYILKLPFTKVPRFIPIPDAKGRYAYTFLDEIIKWGLPKVFPAYDVTGAWSFKVSRDADVIIDEDEGGEQLAENIEEMISKRKIGAITRFQYDDEMPTEVLEVLRKSYAINPEDILEGRRHLKLQDLNQLPNPLGKAYEQEHPSAVVHERWDASPGRIAHILKEDEALYVPYVSFKYLLDLLIEAGNDPLVKAIKLTQYRVAEDSEVIDALIKAASGGKEVTVFVELKARFDEENNLLTAQRMTRHGVKIIYSLPKLKVHAKTCVIEFGKDAVPEKPGIAVFSTGNFNEKTARFYSDVLIFTSRPELSGELIRLFRYLEDPSQDCSFDHILVARKGMVERIHSLIDYEIDQARKGLPAKITLKMNSLEETGVIEKLYRASEAGVKIDLLIRGICRLIPGQPFSKNIRVIRLVDMYLEHARIWNFHHGGEELFFISSADWMSRNLYRRIECAAPVYDPKIKAFLRKVLDVCLSDNVNATLLDENLRNNPIEPKAGEPLIRTQMELYHTVRDFVKK